VNFETLVNEHQDSVYRQLLRVCGNHADAEDVLIEALLKAYRNLEQLRDSNGFRAWLAQIARRVCWQLKQKEALQPLLQLSMLDDEGREVPATGDSAEMQYAKVEMKKLLDDAIESLQPQYREVYRLRDIEERGGKAVAVRLGITEAAMKTRLHRARIGIREYLNARLAPPTGS
jgi:RNA polymerase sigma-70 factor (ECF subfamily)